MSALNCLNNILEADEVTERVVGAINRSNSLAIKRIDDTTTAQINKIKVLMEKWYDTE